MAQEILKVSKDNPAWPPQLMEVLLTALPPGNPDVTNDVASADNRAALCALRLTCRTLRLQVDASIKTIRLKEPVYETLAPVLDALPRLTGAKRLEAINLTNGGLAAFAGLAVPRLSQLTSLDLIGVKFDIMFSGARYAAPRGGMVLAQHLSALQHLEEFNSPFCQNTWGPVGWDIALALARLPALRVLKLWCDITGEMIRRPCDTLGADAWRSLELLKAVDWSEESFQALAQAKLPRLTELHCRGLSETTPGSLISDAVWAPQLQGLEFKLWGSRVQREKPYEVLSDLRLDNLKTLRIVGDIGAPESTHAPTGWDVPKLETLSLELSAIGRAAAASFAGFRLPSLTALELVGTCRTALSLGVPTSSLSILLHAPWAPHLRALSVYGPGPKKEDAQAWAAVLADAPLKALRELTVWSGHNADAAAAALLDSAPWLRGLERIVLQDVCDATLAALRAGKGGFAKLEAAGRVTYVTLPIF